MKDFYYILGTANNATAGEIDAAYQKLAKKLKPAEHEDDYFLESHFKEISEAYTVLSDPAKRRRYDAMIRKSQQKRFYWFRIGHLDIAATLTLIGFTGLFGWYVIRSVTGSKVKPALSAAPIAAIPEVKIKRHKIHRLAKRRAQPGASLAAPIKALLPAAVTMAVISKPKPASVIRDTTPAKPSRPAPAVVAKITPPAATDMGFDAQIKANETGVVHLHQSPSYRSTVVYTIPDHARVKVLETGNNFYKIAYNEQTGYVPKWTIPAQ